MNYNVDEKGYYGDFGGAFIPEMLYPNVEELRQKYVQIMEEPSFQMEFQSLLKEYVSVREATLSLFENFSAIDLLKLGTASGASVSVRGIGFCLLGHELHHKQVIIERYL